MKNNNLKGFSSIGLQIVVFIVIVSITAFTVITSTYRSAGAPPGKIVVQEVNKAFDVENMELAHEEEHSMEDTMLFNNTNSIINDEILDESPEQQNTIDTVDEYDNGQALSENKEKVELSLQVERAETSQPIVSFTKETKVEKINYQTIKENDNNLEAGKESVSQKGEQGIRTIIYDVEYIDGKESNRVETSNNITKDPIDEIIKIGTKKVESSIGKDLPNNFPSSNKADLEERMLNLINEHRINNGLKALVAKKDLQNSARYKSLSMLQLNYFSHNNTNFPDSSLGYLMRTVFAYSHYSGFGENIGYIKSSNLKPNAIDMVFESFKASSGHNKNMLRESFKYVGIGVVFSETPGSAFGGPTIFVTQHFAQ